MRWSGSRTHPPAVPVRCDATGLQGVTFNGSGSRLAVLERAPKGATSAALQAQVWDVEHGSPVGDRFLVKGEGAVVALDGAGMLLASADGNRLVIQETTHGRVVGVWEFPGRSVASLIWHPNRGLLAVDLEIELRLYDIGRSAQAWAAPVRLPMPLSKVAFSPDGRSLATACSDRSVLPGEARIWEVASGEPITPPLRHKDGVLSLAFSPDGATIATASEDFTALLWEVRTGRSVGRPFRHPDEVADVSFDEQGKWLATACRDGKARVWDLETNEPLIPGFSHPSRLFKVRFGPDRASLITETGEGLRTQWALTFDHRPADYLYRLARLLAPESAAFEDTVAPANSARLKAEYDALTARALP